MSGRCVGMPKLKNHFGFLGTQPGLVHKKLFYRKCQAEFIEAPLVAGTSTSWAAFRWAAIRSATVARCDKNAVFF
jgi:hypothetical protein